MAFDLSQFKPGDTKRFSFVADYELLVILNDLLNDSFQSENRQGYPVPALVVRVLYDLGNELARAKADEEIRLREARALPQYPMLAPAKAASTATIGQQTDGVGDEPAPSGLPQTEQDQTAA